VKTCRDCGVEKTLDLFPFEGAYVRPTCRACERIRKRESKARQAAARKEGNIERYICVHCKAVLRNAARAGRAPCCRACGRDGKYEPPHRCADCGTPCARNRNGQPSRCRVHADAARIRVKKRLTDDEFADKRAKQAAYDRNARVLKTSKGRQEKPERYMEFALGEFWKMDSKCRGRWGKPCTQGPGGKPKWIVGTGQCYFCATGRPRQHLRLAELRDRELA